MNATQQLRKACKFGDRNAAVLALKQGADVNYRDRHNLRADDYAAQYGYEELERLIKAHRCNHNH